MGLCLGVFKREQTEEQGNLDKVCGAQENIPGGVSCYCGQHDEAKGNISFSLGRGVLVGKVPEHAGETLVKVL